MRILRLQVLAVIGVVLCQVVLFSTNKVISPDKEYKKVISPLHQNTNYQNVLSPKNDSFKFKGICIRNWQTGGFSSQYYKDRINECVERLNIDSVEIIPNTYQLNERSTNVEYRTPVSINETKNLINYCKSLGLKVILCPHVESDDGAWRATYKPTNVKEWFLSYQTMIVKWAILAQETGCEMFCVGTEYKSLTVSEYRSNWQTIINAVRKVYKGPITYGANCSSVLNDEFSTLSFWDLVDVIGLNNYLVPTKTITQPNADYDRLMQNNYKNQNLIQPIDKLSKKYNKPIIFIEYGNNSTVDSYQANFLESYLRNYGKYKWNRGMFLWVIDPEQITNSFYPIGRKSESIIYKYYSQFTKKQKKQ